MKRIILRGVTALLLLLPALAPAQTVNPAFVQNGAGAKARSFLEKARADYDIKDSGAVCNGVADDTAAIQAAVNAAGRVYFGGPDRNCVTREISVPSNRVLFARGARLTQKAGATAIFSAYGTQGAHLSNIRITGFDFVGVDATVTHYAINFGWVDRVKVDNNSFVGIYPFWAGSNGVAYGSVALATIQDQIEVSNNHYSSSVTEDSNAPIFVRYAKHVIISNNRLVGYSRTAAGIEVFGGDSNPASDGTKTADRKCSDFVIEGNALYHFTSGVNVAQCRRGVVRSNILNDTNESLAIFASFDVSVTGNTIVTAGPALQTAGINRNLVFADNVVNTSARSGAILIQPTWTSADNAGPISFLNNHIHSSVANTAYTYDVGHLIVKGNTFHNVTYHHVGASSQLEIEGNTWIYDVFPAIPPESLYLLRLTGFNSTMSGIASSNKFARVRGNIFEDRTAAFTGAFIRVNDPGVSSSLSIEGNTFIGNARATNIQLYALSRSVALTTVIRGNLISGLIDTASNNTATTKTVTLGDNVVYGSRAHWLGAPPTSSAHYFSVGSVVYSNNPATDGVIGWVCTVAGAPGTWKAFR